MSGDPAPERLGKYEIRRVLGRGAMGTVYDGWDPVIQRRVAIKTVRLPAGDDEAASEGLDRFKREAQAAGRLTHPNIVGVFDYGETDELAFIVMEFVEGRSLKEMLDGDLRLPVSEAVRLVGQVLNGLSYSHGRGVIHRDVKPANIMVTNSDGQAKIADFGIARIESSSLTQAGTVMGTPAYMSPEQFMGQVVDGRTDLYACGVMLYQLLTGERPFEGSMSSIMHKVMTTIPPVPSALAVTAPRSLDGVVARAIARRPEDRFSSAAEFAEALLNPPVPIDPAPDADATVVAKPAAAPIAAPVPRPPSRSPLLPIGIAGGLLAVAAVAFFLWPRPAPVVPVPAPVEPAAAPALPSRSAEALPPIEPARPTAPPEIAAPASGPEPNPAPPPASSPIVAATPAPMPAPTPAPAPSANEPAPVETAMAPPLDPAAVSCSLVTSAAGGATALTDARNRTVLERAAPGTPLRIVDPVFCPVLDLLRGIPAGSGGGLSITQDGGPAPLADNQVIALHATMPGFAGFLQVAYVQHDGTVAPLVPGPGYPEQTVPARGSIALGQARKGASPWLVGPPFGTDMIVAVASTAPLWTQQRPTTETLSSYLPALRAAVDALRRRGGNVAVAALPIETRPAR